MLITTTEIIRASLKADPSVTPAERNRLLTALHKGGTETTPRVLVTEPKIVRFKQAAASLSCTTRQIAKLCDEGSLVRATLPGRKRAFGVTSESLAALVKQTA
jgi:predicted nucleotide-binding protein